MTEDLKGLYEQHHHIMHQLNTYFDGIDPCNIHGNDKGYQDIIVCLNDIEDSIRERTAQESTYM